MNDRAREALVAAALSGHKQSRGTFHHRDGGDCAMGVLNIARHNGSREKAVAEMNKHGACPWRKVETWAGMTQEESQEMTQRNDEGWDFLTIARKCGINDEEVQS